MTTTVSAEVKIKTAAPESPYFPLYEQSGKLREWSVKQITGESLAMKPVGAGMYVISLALSVLEIAAMAIANLAIVVKNLLCCNCSSEDTLKIDDVNKPDPANIDGVDETEQEKEKEEEEVVAKTEGIKMRLPTNAGKAAIGTALGAGLGAATVGIAALPIVAGAAIAGMGTKLVFDGYQNMQRNQAVPPVAQEPAPKVIKSKAKVQLEETQAPAE